MGSSLIVLQLLAEFYDNKDKQKKCAKWQHSKQTKLHTFSRPISDY